jgi:arylsulfatase A-like enzyme
MFAVARRGPLRLAVVFLFHLITILIALITSGASQYFAITGTPLGMDPIIAFLTSPGEFGGVVASEVTPTIVALLVAILAYAVFGPWLLTRLVERRRPAASAETPRLSWLGFGGVCLAVYGLFFFSAMPAGGAAGASNSFAREPFVNVVMSEVERIRLESDLNVDTAAAIEEAPVETRLSETPRAQERNVVMIHLESTRAKSVDPYNEDVEITPYMDELSEKSLFAERGYAVVPHTTNALTASICGIDPPTGPRGTDSVGDDIPANCLPELLGEEGYNSVYFTSSVETFERRPEVVENMGFDEFYPVETMDTEGFEQANYFGYEDDVMLEPSREWLEENGDEPFISTYETITPHHDYQAPDRYGIKDFAEDDALNRYQNSVRYVDFFLKNLIQQYKDLGLYEDTVFVIYGDHGEAFGEHGRNQHDMVPWEEGVRVPLMILDPQKLPDGRRVEEPVNQVDILPTVSELLGYEIEGGEYPGASMLDAPEDRSLKFSCWNESGCLASLEDGMKYIYHYGDEPEELYDLSEDPREENNLSGEADPTELERRRTELLEWRAKVDAVYAASPEGSSGGQ